VTGTKTLHPVFRQAKSGKEGLGLFKGKDFGAETKGNFSDTHSRKKSPQLREAP